MHYCFTIPLLMVVALYLYHITKYSKLEYLYKRTTEINNIMLKMTEDMQEYYDIEILYRQILIDTISLIKDAEAGSILIYNKEKDLFEFKTAVGFDLDKLKSVSLKKEELFLYNKTQLKYPSIIRNPVIFDKEIVNIESYDKFIRSNSLDIKAVLSTPIYVNGELYGILNVDSKTKENAFNKYDVRLTKYISAHLEIAIKNVLLMNDLIRALRIDDLTGLYNKRYFEEIMEEKINKAYFDNTAFCLVMIDLDDFKIINDTMGHKTGDEVLRYFSKILKETLKDSDITARYAGDEFVLAIFDSDEQETDEIIRLIKQKLKENLFNGIEIKFSSGVCQYRRGMNLEDIIITADNNMYSDKRMHKRCGCI
ncbi:hypothetical protein Q428_11635 [Fervidicella metallireducens AeB]|uniref:GGDEF domain-containing protein n=1 Tax=Fervidicella metallireducens AeB TaxID=1403537 RepID=A0A017RSJ1_9CLOT|nr:sensor domain-containing diguanylate cyclase [Fervidicella metallireducens]EYE87738.1 hypothetical protein Q428_11635 [Fervidicella metallireducens AeB]